MKKQNQPQFLLIYTTTPNLLSAKKICRYLIQHKLIACGNILSPLESYYNWNGKLQHIKEWPIILKTLSDQWKNVESALLKIHPYDTPCIIGWRANVIENNYLEWVHASLLKEAPSKKVTSLNKKTHPIKEFTQTGSKK